MKRKIVLAEDEPQIAKLIEFKLKKGGYSVTSKENGEEALKTIKADLQLYAISHTVFHRYRPPVSCLEYKAE